MTRPTIDGQPAPEPEPMPELVLREIDLPIVHESPLDLWITAATAPEPRCKWCGTKLVLASGACGACVADLDGSVEGLR